MSEQHIPCNVCKKKTAVYNACTKTSIHPSVHPSIHPSTHPSFPPSPNVLHTNFRNSAAQCALTQTRKCFSFAAPRLMNMNTEMTVSFSEPRLLYERTIAYDQGGGSARQQLLMCPSVFSFLPRYLRRAVPPVLAGPIMSCVSAQPPSVPRGAFPRWPPRRTHLH